MTPEITLDYQSILALRSHEETMRLHAQALAAHCECLAMNAENMIAAIANISTPYPEAAYHKMMQKWGSINTGGLKDFPTSGAHWCTNCESIWTDWQQARIEEQQAEIYKFRKASWLLYPDPFGMKYGDDGEMQSGRIDFKRAPIDELIEAYTKAVQSITAEIASLKDELTTEREKVKELREYLQHKPNCSFWGARMLKQVNCNCGLSQLIGEM